MSDLNEDELELLREYREASATNTESLEQGLEALLSDPEVSGQLGGAGSLGALKTAGAIALGVGVIVVAEYRETTPIRPSRKRNCWRNYLRPSRL